MEATPQPFLTVSVDINKCGLALCVKEHNGPIKHWVMLYFNSTNEVTTALVLKRYFELHKFTPNRIVIEKIYFSKIRGIVDLLTAEGITRGVCSAYFPQAEIILVPSISYKTHYGLATGNHKKNKEAVVKFLEKELLAHFPEIDLASERAHDLADTLLLCKFIEDTYIKK
jgi:hypothetical protein